MRKRDVDGERGKETMMGEEKKGNLNGEKRGKRQ